MLSKLFNKVYNINLYFIFMRNLYLGDKVEGKFGALIVGCPWEENEKKYLDSLLSNLTKKNIFGDYFLSYRNSLFFGEDMYEDSGSFFVLEKNSQPLIALKYFVAPWKISVEYIQRVHGASMKSAKDCTSIHPYEFLFKEFLGNMAPILDSYPFEQFIFGDEWNREYAKPIRDRFLDSKWRLNPKKKRVREIFGETLSDKISNYKFLIKI